jgi:hypothetical protein
MRDSWNNAWSQVDRTLGLYGKALDIVEPVLDVGAIMATDLKTVAVEDIEDRISARTSAKRKITRASKPAKPKAKRKANGQS